MLTFNEERDKAMMSFCAAPESPNIWPDGRPVAYVNRDLPVSLVIHRDVNRQILHYCVVWPAYDTETTQVHKGYKVIEIRQNNDEKAAITNPYLFRFSFRPNGSQSIQHWTLYELGHYNAGARMGILTAFQSWEPKRPFGNCITCIFNVLEYLVDIGALNDTIVTKARLQSILSSVTTTRYTRELHYGRDPR
ncbi:uncharacterized protein STEHIDRAFT_116491 [Stereum hirsutum FP-91666 SS1]|uniref:Uncharacterized protein n=1 Tax=Stereum hirsutum (strain FP-91666) TaxID=721885 RepID=R7RVZ3_STEHR|nr:uncharacterized protein STEHIDRAFT_116491 [Stereum hirsutum FP-91666 SS1]EIM79441.1 hypothetical protein STEHIDRAFT_116491 [Stereum hirsutum FP-91666 SS1]